ncbi:MAG: hypothetical protein JST54_27620 [Deltaproteobacteria bacterium]|nr:hypothetical protein [Deltaproteobacteria bacterium]
MNLVIELDAASREAVRALATLPELRGDHVTLVFGIHPADLDPRWIPGGYQIGETVELRAVALAENDRIQALRVEIAGSSERPHDGRVLHVTVSRALDARSRDSNDLLAADPGRPLELALRGSVGWRE